MQPLRFIILISLVTFIGWNILYAIWMKRRYLNIWEALAVSYGLGIGFVSLEMFALYLLGLKFSLFNIIAPWAVLFLINLVRCLKRREKFVAVKEMVHGEGHPALTVFLIFGITFEAIYAFSRALIKPIESYDAIAIYAIKSKIFYLAGAIPQDFFRSLVNRFPHPDYPLNIPLAETLTYIFLGGLNDLVVKAIFPIYFVAILTMLYYAIRRFASKTYGLLFVFILASIPQFANFAQNAYLEVPLAYYYFASALFLFRYFEDRRDAGPLIISAIMVGLAGWTKNEGLMYCVINIILICLFFVTNHKDVNIKDIYRLMLYGAIIFVVSLPWLAVKISAHLTNTDVGVAGAGQLNVFKQLYKMGPILYEFQKQCLGPKKWNIFWPIIIFALIANHKKAFTAMARYITISLALAIGGYIFFYMVGNVEINFFVSKTWSRFLLHFLPVAVYWLAVMFREDIKL